VPEGKLICQHVWLSPIQQRVASVGPFGLSCSAMRRHCARACSASSWAKAAAMKAETMRLIDNNVHLSSSEAQPGMMGSHTVLRALTQHKSGLLP
jgi:hypothetical protein